MRYFQVVAGPIEVADQTVPVYADHDRSSSTNIAYRINRPCCAAGAGDVSTVDDLQGGVCRIVVADQSQSVGSDGDRSVTTNISC